MTTRFSEWTKKLGQQHFSMDGSSETLCGQAMLGNNYARYLYEEDKTPCPDCAQKKEFIELVRTLRRPHSDTPSINNNKRK